MTKKGNEVTMDDLDANGSLDKAQIKVNSGLVKRAILRNEELKA